MSSHRCLVYFGIRFDVLPGEISGLEMRTDRRLVAARNAGLKYYWGNFGGLHERYVMFIGAELGIMGPENSAIVAASLVQIEQLIEVTSEKLIEAGFGDQPSLHLEWQPDI